MVNDLWNQIIIPNKEEDTNLNKMKIHLENYCWSWKRFAIDVEACNSIFWVVK